MPIFCFIEQILILGPNSVIVDLFMDNIADVLQQHCQHVEKEPNFYGISNEVASQYVKRLNFLSNYEHKIKGVKIALEPRAASSSSQSNTKYNIPLLSQSEIELRNIVKSGLLIYFLEKETHQKFLEMMALKKYTPSLDLGRRDNVLLTNFIFNFIASGERVSESSPYFLADNVLHFKLSKMAFPSVLSLNLKLDFLKDTELGSVKPFVNMDSFLFEVAKKNVMTRVHEQTVSSLTNLITADPRILINVNVLRYITVPGQSMQIVSKMDQSSLELLDQSFRKVYKKLKRPPYPILETQISKDNLLSTLEKRSCRCATTFQLEVQSRDLSSSQDCCTLRCSDIFACLTDNDKSRQQHFNLENLADQIERGLAQLNIDYRQKVVFDSFKRMQVQPHSLRLCESQSKF